MTDYNLKTAILAEALNDNLEVVYKGDTLLVYLNSGLIELN